MKKIIHSSAEMVGFAQEIATDLRKKKYSRIGLTGPLGAGKTTLVNAIANALKSKDKTGSPTFTLMHEYQTLQGILLHIDLYRADKKDKETIEMMEERIEESDFTLIEWVERIPKIKQLIERMIKMSHGQHEGERIVEIEGAK